MEFFVTFTMGQREKCANVIFAYMVGLILRMEMKLTRVVKVFGEHLDVFYGVLLFILFVAIVVEIPCLWGAFVYYTGRQAYARVRCFFLLV